MRTIKTVIWNIFQEIVYLFKKRDEKIVVMGSWFGERFADNTRYLFQYLSDNKSEMGLKKVIWVTRSDKLKNEIEKLGYEVYMMESQESIYYHKKAGIHIVCNSGNVTFEKKGDILSQFSNGAIKINLFHGLAGIKGVGFASREYAENKDKHRIFYSAKEWLRKSKLMRKYGILPGGWGDAYYLSTTSFMTELFKKYFMLPDENFIESAYPRNEKNIKLLPSESEIIDKIKYGKKVILYMPTFRENYDEYKSPLDSKELVEIIEENGLIWIEKNHAYDKRKKTNEYVSESVLKLEQDFDASVLIPYVDLIITDYSSVSWDALYNKKPVIFYMPDFEYYRDCDRGFVLKPEEFVIGPFVKNLEDLKEIIEKYKENFLDMLPDNEEELFKKFWGCEKDCSQIWKDILRKVKE